MKCSHIHIRVRDLHGAVAWFQDKAGVRPGFQNGRMASLPLDGVSLVLDIGDDETAITVALESRDCDRDYRDFLARGAEPLGEPADQPWGVRAAYVKGPGAISLELEQPII